MRKEWLLMALCAGCSARDVDAAPESVAREHEVALLEGATQADLGKLAARIDVSRLALEPLAPVEQAAAFDEKAALAALTAATGGEYTVQSEGDAWTATNGEFTATRDANGGVNVEGGPQYDARLAHAGDELFVERAAALFGAFGGEVTDELDLKHLGLTTRSIGDDVPADERNQTERLGSKVFAIRTLGGLRVAGNRLVASYLNDGRLHALRGAWSTIDVSRSKLRSELTTEQVVARALEQLVAHNVNPNREEPIVLESFYELRPDANGAVAVLRASALVVTYNSEGEPGRRERHDFDI